MCVWAVLCVCGCVLIVPLSPRLVSPPSRSSVLTHCHLPPPPLSPLACACRCAPCGCMAVRQCEAAACVGLCMYARMYAVGGCVRVLLLVVLLLCVCCCAVGLSIAVGGRLVGCARPWQPASQPATTRLLDPIHTHTHSHTVARNSTVYSSIAHTASVSSYHGSTHRGVVSTCEAAPRCVSMAVRPSVALYAASCEKQPVDRL